MKYSKKGSILVVAIIFIMSLFLFEGGTASAASVGDVLPEPEEGWNRYDDRDVRVKYQGPGWTHTTDNSAYLRTISYAPRSSMSRIDFKFEGTKLRLISKTNPNFTDGLIININGVVEHFSEALSINNQVLVYEKTGLEYGEHTVTILKINSGVSTYDFYFDAIDTDGDLVPYDLSFPYLRGSSANGANLWWEPYENATGYIIKRSTTQGGPYIIIANIEESSFSDTTAVEGNTYYYVISHISQSGIGPYSNEVAISLQTTPSALKIDLDALSTVQALEEFTVDVILQNGTNIYAEDFSITYDEEFFEFLGAETVTQGLVVYHREEQPEQLRYIVASQGSQYGISSDTTLVQLRFRAKNNPGLSTIAVVSGLVADHLGKEYETSLGLKEIMIAGDMNPDVNRDGKVSLGDLAIAAYDYGRTTEQLNNPNSDVNMDGEVTELDLVTIVEAMLAEDN